MLAMAPSRSEFPLQISCTWDRLHGTMTTAEEA